MNELNEKRLVTHFPNLYANGMGFECSDGWYNLIYQLSSKLEKMIIEYKKSNEDDPLPPRATQVKEKFGALRFYMSHLTDEMDQAINETEAQSHKVCEECGEVGELVHENGWYRTVCEVHRKN